MGVEDRLTALRVKFFGKVLFEHDPEGVIEDLGYRLKAQNACLNDLSTQPALDHDLAADLHVDGCPGAEARQAQKTKSLGQGRAFGLAGNDVQRCAGAAHAIQVDKSFYLRFLFIFNIFRHFIYLFY